MREGWGWNEQYLVEAFLQFNSGDEVVLGAQWAMRNAADAIDVAFPQLAKYAPETGASLWNVARDDKAKLFSQLKSLWSQRVARDDRTPILYLAPWVDIGGSDKATVDWFRWIDRERFAPSLITTQPSPNRWLDEIRPYATEARALPDLLPGTWFPRFIFEFIASRRIELVHIMNSRIAFDLLPDVVSMRDRPATVVQLHVEEEDRSGYVRYVTTRYDNLIDVYSVTSHQLSAAMADYQVPPSSGASSTPASTPTTSTTAR